MDPSVLTPLQTTDAGNDAGNVKKVRDTKSAAREFEAMMIGELMNSAFSSDQMGLDGESGSCAQTMLDFGREHLSRIIAEGGGLGLGKIIEAGLAKDQKNAATAVLKR